MRTIIWLGLLVAAAAAINGCSGSSSAQSPGGVVNEVTISGVPRGAAILGSGLVVFLRDGNVSGPEPWVTDGTQGGTFKLAETISGNLPGSIDPAGVLLGSDSAGRTTFMVEGDRAYFFTQLGDLWVTDGTIAGTQIAEDLSPDGFYFSVDAVAREGNDLVVGGCRSRLDGTPTPLDCSLQTIMLD